MLINVKNGLVKGTMMCLSATFHCCDFIIDTTVTAFKWTARLITFPLVAMYGLLGVCV